MVTGTEIAVDEQGTYSGAAVPPLPPLDPLTLATKWIIVMSSVELRLVHPFRVKET